MKDDDPFSLSTQSEVFSPSTDWLTGDAAHKLTRQEQRINDEYYAQLLVIRLQAEKTRRSQDYFADLHRNAERTFVTMADAIWEMRMGKREPVLQQLIDLFTRENIMQGGAHIRAATAAGSSAILKEVHRTLYYASEEERQSLFTWLFGG